MPSESSGKKIKKDKEIPKPYKLAHQILSLTGISFQQETVIGFTELTLIPIKDSFRYIWINCKQLCIYKITLNDTLEVQFQYFDPLLEICPATGKHRNLEFLNKNQVQSVISVDPEYGRGELVITVPSEAQHMIQEGKPLRVGIEFSLEKPQAGLQFVVPTMEGSNKEKESHMFSYGFENSSRLWFPCIDIHNEVCTWRLEFTVDEALTAVSCGDLVDTVFTTDMRRKTFHYKLDVPTSAPNIALAVGPFEIYMDPYMNEITHFCLPSLLPVMKATSKHLHESFEFFEEILSIRYPYSCYKQVYVDEAYSDLQAYTTMSIVSINLLCSTRIIDQVYLTRKALVLCVAQQFFGCFINRNSWADAWLTGGISRYLMGLYVKKFFGFNEYKDWIHCELREIVEYESKYGGILLDPSASLTEPQHHPLNTTASQDNSKDTFYFSVKSPHASSPRYIEMYYKKAHLIMRMLELKIGNELMMQVLNKHLSLGSVAAEHKGHPSGWGHMVMSTNTFTGTIYTVTGKDITVFCDQWVRQGGHAKFKMKFLFNRKRNIVEMTIEQNAVGELGVKRYVGPLVVWLQELDGTFKHTLQIEQQVAKKEIVCHSKSRRNKKKKIPLCTGEEVDMDLSHLDADSPVLWLRLDPDMTLMRSVDVEQPDNQWQYQLRHEKDVTAQTDAIDALQKLAKLGAVTPEMRNTLNHILENEQLYYKVRVRAASCLTIVANAMVANWNGQPAMMQIFRKIFGSFAAPHIIKLHDFTNFQHYFLLKAIPVAMAGLRTIHKHCPQEVLNFLLDLFKYSDNSRNQFSDNYYRASLVDALGACVSPAMLMKDPFSITSENMSEDMKKVLGEVVRVLNLEKLLPCYKHTVTCSCLKAIRVLQKSGHLPPKSALFISYAKYSVYIDVRLAAIDQLVDFLPVDGTQAELNYLLTLAESDNVPLVRYELLKRLSMNPPFQMGQSHKLDTENLVDRLWTLMNVSQANDSRIRCVTMDLYFALYGRRRPACVPAHIIEPEVLASEKDHQHSLSDHTFEKETTMHHFHNEDETPTTVSSSNPLLLKPISFVQQKDLSSISRPSSRNSVSPDRVIPSLKVKDDLMAPVNQELEDRRNLSESRPKLSIKPREELMMFSSSENNDSSRAMETEIDLEEFARKSQIFTESQGISDDVEPCVETSVSHALPSTVGTEKQSVSITSAISSVLIQEAGGGGGERPSSVASSTGGTTTPADLALGGSSSSSKHKSKKRKKDKKHKKHKRHKHELKLKLEKFAEEENLSSGSSNPPSPSSLSQPSAPSTPAPPDTQI